MPSTSNAGKVRGARPLLAGAAVAVLWTALAAWQPTTTWHLAPILLLLAPPWSAHDRGDHRWRWIITGAGLALATTLLLNSLALLRGPSLLGNDATIEALLITGATTLVATIANTRATATTRHRATQERWSPTGDDPTP